MSDWNVGRGKCRVCSVASEIVVYPKAKIFSELFYELKGTAAPTPFLDRKPERRGSLALVGYLVFGDLRPQYRYPARAGVDILN
jgi:hypothetical protein